jgi:hypothetical protein
MNKILCTVAFIFISYCSLTAQDAKGNYSLEIIVDPAALFDANAGPMFQMPEIKGRYFMGSDVAIRLGIGAGFSSTKYFTDSEGNDYTKSSSSNVTLSPGIEKGFGTEKFVAYIGCELPITISSSKLDVSTNGDVITTKNPNSTAYFGVGLNAVFGFDYYLLDNVFIGAELSPGLWFRKYSDTSISGTTTTKGGTGLNFTFSSSSGIRLGVRF